MTNWETCPAVESVPGRLSGAWVFTGTRVPVSALLENLESGATIEQFLDWFQGVENGRLEPFSNTRRRRSEPPRNREDSAWPYVQLRIEDIRTAISGIQPGDLKEVPI